MPFEEKHSDIQKRIGEHKAKNKKDKNPYIASTNQAFNIAVELVSGVIVGVIVGLLFDKLFDSKPIFLIICLILSMIAAFKLIWNKYIKQ